MMNKLWIGCLPALLGALLLGAGGSAYAQNCDYRRANVCVELTGGDPVPGEAIGLEVTVEGATNLGSGELFYRPTGSTAFASANVQLVGNTYSATIPASAVTERGLDVYGTYFDGDELFTYPEENPTGDPIHASVLIGAFEVPVMLPRREYRMVSIAVDLQGGTAVDELDDDFGAPDSLRWRAARWNPLVNAYEELPAIEDDLTEGTAFWIITNTGGRFDVELATSTNPDSIPSVTLLPGYNQIGNPYAFPVAWEDVCGASCGSVGPPMAYNPASNGYVESAVLEPWRGYFVENRTGQAVTFAVPDREAVGGGGVRAPETSYAVRVEARSGDYADLNNAVGFATAATSESHRMRLGEPPPIGPGLRVSVVGAGERLMRSLKPESAEGADWDVEVTASDDLLASPRRVRVSLVEDGTLPAGFRLYVLDRDRGTALALTGGSFEVGLSREAPVRRLRLIAGTEGFAQTRSEGAPLEASTFALDGGYPNPFTERTTLSYRLEERGSATLEVFDLLGRRVRVLADADHGAGPHAVEWDGHDAAGRPVANGIYLVRLRAGDASATRRVSVLR